ncbi:MAG TPA: sulfatase-like hydrolase/transferase [Candidatus Hydrogenedentes bacterium]|nr:sulfatase-like hydrolase/transferase [Candidatus Hydrogenedentota bacterium]
MASSMDRRHFLTLAAGCAAGMSPWPASGARAQAAGGRRPPNFLVIMADDIGAKELSCYGHATHRTPHLDGLARDGVQFQTCYATPICHPTRLMIMTGQYGCHNGVYNFAGRRGGPDPNDPVEDMTNHVNFAQILKQQGYATALAGKWQLSGKVPTLIHECGFDDYCFWAYKHNLPEGVEHTGAWESPDKNKPSRYWHPSIMKNGEYVPTKPDDYGPDLYADFLIDFMGRNKDRPFLAYYPMCLTHGPHVRTPDTKALEDPKYDKPPRVYQGAVEYMDKIVGRLAAALDALGLRENTIILFTGDNGTGGDGKGDPTELGARVPMIVNAPGIVKARGATDALTDLSDVLPTLCAFAGAPSPADRPIDGRSLAPFLRGETDAARDWIFSYIADRRILRTSRWLLEDNSPLHYGRLYDCGDSRDGSGYREVTVAGTPEVLTIKEQFDAILGKLPAPHIPEEGHPAAQKKAARNDRGRERKRR